MKKRSQTLIERAVPDIFSLEGKVAIVTGGSRGIGRETALLLAAFGAEVVVHYHRKRRAAEEVQRQIWSQGRSAEIYGADCSSYAQCRRLVNFTQKRFGRIDILVNNAAIWEEAPIHRLTPQQLEKTLAVNLKSIFYCTRLAAPIMMRQKSGSIVNLSSTAGQRGEAFHSHYAATKGAITSLTKSLAAELAPYRIRVNAVAPGWVDTDMSHGALTGRDRKKILGAIPLGRAAQPREIAACIAFVASEAAAFVTGEIFNVNGGAVLCG